MKKKFTLSILITLLFSSSLFSQIVLSTSTANNGSGGVFLRLTTNSTGIVVSKFNTYFSSAAGTNVAVEVWVRDGDYTGFTAANTGWTLLGTASAVSAGTATLAELNVASLNITLAATSVKSIYLHSITTGGGIRYTGTASIPPVTTWTDANIELFSNTTRTGTVAFAGTQFSPRTFAGSIEYNTTTLPVSWISITGANRHGTAEINFTVEETNVSIYHLQRETAGGYIQVASISSRGNGRNVYAMNDAAAFDDNRINAVYRIRQIDIDGNTKYSPSVLVKKQITNSGVSAYPNPFTNSLQVTVKTSQKALLINAAGEQIRVLQLSTGTNVIDVQNLVPGVYVVKTQNGELIRLIKQ